MMKSVSHEDCGPYGFAYCLLYREPQTRKVEGCVPAVPFMRFRYFVVCKGALVE